MDLVSTSRAKPHSRVRHSARRATVVLTLAACAPAVEKANTDSSAPAIVADSLVLERSVCFGFCPAYRLRLSKTGNVLYESRNPRESLVTAVDTVAQSTLPNMIRAAQTAGFFDLPPEIAADSALCPLRATDHPTVVITIFGPETKVVTDYLGCFATTDRATVPALTRLRAYEVQIDSVLGSSQWTHR